ncbi:MAG: dihydrofolate reductase family protein [Myxococcota bacterium]|nr:dihydrofolate reductase family protein [Myxococcota bacterium]
MPAKERPYVVCHMGPSVDGRIVVDKWKLDFSAVTAAYEGAAEQLGADAWIIGRVSMEPYAGKSKVPKRRRPVAKIPRADFVADPKATSFAIAVDPSGKLTWRKSEIDGEHIISVLTEKVSDDYLAFLQNRGVSYVFAGKKDIDLLLALRKLRALFGVERLLLEGGGAINGSFLDAGLIDELSIVIMPIADGSIGTPTLFDAPKATGRGRPLKLLTHEIRPGGVVWLRYTFIAK